MNSLAMPVLLIVLAWLLWPRRAGTRAAHVLNRGRQAPDWRELLAADPLAAARRKVEVERLARTALRRGIVAADPHCAPWGQGI